MAFHWVFHCPVAEQADAFERLAREMAPEFEAVVRRAAPADERRALRADFPDEDHGREYWLELHSRCLDQNLAMELVADFDPGGGWVEEEAAPVPAALSVAGAAEAETKLQPQRPDLPEETLYDILRAGDPEMDVNLDRTIAWIENAGLPVINLLSYLDLPLYTEYAAAHEDEREQNLFLHMLHTWACYRRFGAVTARIPPELTKVFQEDRYLRLNTTMFRTPAPAMCLQLPPWEQAVRGTEAAGGQWAKEIYLTHLEPPTPADDRELTLMIVTHDARGEFGFIPLEVPLSLPGVGQSVDAFFAPGLADDELGANSQDLRRLTMIAATYCLYACARDPKRYLSGGGGE